MTHGINRPGSGSSATSIELLDRRGDQQDEFDSRASQRITASVPRIPSASVRMPQRPLHKNYGVRLHAVVDPLNHQAQQNEQQLIKLYTLTHLKTLREIPDRQIVGIHAWIDTATGVIQRFVDPELRSRYDVEDSWVCAIIDLYRAKGHLFIEDVWVEGLAEGFTEWFVNQRGRQIPVPADGAVYRPVQTSPDVQKRHNNAKLHELYAHPAVQRMMVDDTVVMEAWVNSTYGFITTTTVPNTYAGDASEVKVGMMVECDKYGLLVWFTELTRLRGMPPILRRYFENPLHSTIPPDGWAPRTLPEDTGAAAPHEEAGFLFTDSEVNGHAHPGTDGDSSRPRIVAAEHAGPIHEYQEMSTAAIGAPTGVIQSGVTHTPAPPSSPVIPPVLKR